MSFKIRRCDYFNVSVKDQPGEAYKILSWLAGLGVNLLAFTGVPTGPDRTLLSVFPEDPGKLSAEASRAGMNLDGPHAAVLVQGDDELGSLAAIHMKLMRSGVNVYASTGVTDGAGCFAYLIYLRSGEIDRALRALEGLVRPG